MKAFHLCTIALIVLFPSNVFSQKTVTVTGISGEDTDSRPRINGRIRDENGQFYGAEQDDIYETLEAVNSLNRFSELGGTVIIDASVPVKGTGYAGIVPIHVKGAGPGQAIAGTIYPGKATLTVSDVQFINDPSDPAPTNGRPIRAQDAKRIAANVDSNGQGRSVETKEIFDDAVVSYLNVPFTDRGTLCYYGETLKYTARGCTFRGTGLQFIPASGVSNIDVQNCTFTNCSLAIDDRRYNGTAVYKNLNMKDLAWIGINVQAFNPLEGIQDTPLPPPPAPTIKTVISDSVFENIAYQAVHFHGTRNVTVTNVKASGCGSTNTYRGEDGAGIGGHEGNINILVENCDSRNNKGNGINFDNFNREITLRKNTVINNTKDGITIKECEDVVVEENWTAGNSRNGINFDKVKNWKIHSNAIGVNQQKTEGEKNVNGIVIRNSGDGEIGSCDDSSKGNIISGNTSQGIDILFSITLSEKSHIKIGSNYIGTDGEGSKPIPNGANGIRVYHFVQELYEFPAIDIGGNNPSMDSRRSGDLGVGNIISGNTGDGIDIAVFGYNNFDYPGTDKRNGGIFIWGNYIGMDRTGTKAIPNQGNGIEIHPHLFKEIFIGTEANKEKGNLISGNVLHGIKLMGEFDTQLTLTGVTIANNIIGAGLDGISKGSNHKSGIYLFSSASGVAYNTITKNIIHKNLENGILARGLLAIRNAFSRNSIHKNGLKGIELIDTSERIEVQLKRIPESPPHIIKGKSSVPKVKIEVYTDPVFTGDQPGYWGQGKNYIDDLVADDTGYFEINMNEIPNNGIVTVTAFDPEKNNTSEFSPMLEGVVVQAVGREGNMLVEGKPTAVRIFGDTGNGGEQVAIYGELVLPGDKKILSFNDFYKLSPFGYYESFSDEESRRLASNSLNFHFTKPKSGFYYVILREGEHVRARCNIGLYYFKATKNITVVFVPVVTELRDEKIIDMIPEQQNIQKIKEFVAAVYPVNYDQFLDNSRVSFPIIIFEHPHDTKTKLELLKRIDDWCDFCSIETGYKPDYRVGVVSYDAGFRPPGRKRIYGMTNPSIPNTIAILDKRANGDHTGATLAHEIAHCQPFLLSDTYINGKEIKPVLNARTNDPTKTGRRGNYVLEEHFAYSPTGAVQYMGLPHYGPIFSKSMSPELPSDVAKVYDIMGSSNNKWVDPQTYRILFEKLGGTVGAKSGKTIYLQQEEISPVLVVRGSINKDDTAELYPPIPLTRK